MKTYVAIALLLIMVSCGFSDSKVTGACTIALHWTPPTSRIDGTVFTVDEIGKYTIFMNSEEGAFGGTLEVVMDILGGYLISWELMGVPKGTHWFYMTVTDKGGLESDISNETYLPC